jgi:hypothetical protein
MKGKYTMTTNNVLSLLAAAVLLTLSSTAAQAADKPAAMAAPAWQEDFGAATCKLATSGRNDYFVLEPGHQLVLENDSTKLQITVLDETKVINGVSTRVVEEREWDKGQLHELARNYYAICEQTKDVLHFGEDVEVYENGKFARNEGTWLAGSNGNRPGLVIAGTPKLNMKYYQEIAPGVTMNRGEVVSLTETCKTAAGTFGNCMKVKGTSGMDAKKLEYKYYAPKIGLVRDQNLRLVRYGSAKSN